MRRRELIALLGGAAAAWPCVVRAQQPSIPLIGFLSSRSPGESAGVVAAFRQGLGEAGFVEGRNLSIAFRWAEGHYDRLPTLAAELVGLPVTLLFAAGGPPAAFAAKAATSTTPIVFSAVADPVEIGLVPSLNRPGGNITGMAVFNATLGEKRIELMKELMPVVRVVSYLLNPANQMSDVESQGALAAARALGLELQIFNATSEDELDRAFDTVGKQGARALVVSGEPFFDSQRARIVALSSRYGVAANYAWREYVLAGGLL
jgi:putative tryptophan/tyrosine transport system substrate-binding protein